MGRISGIICEFNPLHEGHKYVIGEAKKYGDVVCIMSGNFVQRGECAVRDKYERAKDALDAGADLVVELPFPWCAAPAEFFARGGVNIASALGVTDLVFGSESGDLEAIEKAVRLSVDSAFSDTVSSLCKNGTGYAAARYEAAKALCPEAAGVFDSSNDSLAVEYLRQGEGLGLDFHAIKRIGGVSASEIRERLGFSHRLFDVERDALCLGVYRRGTFDSESGVVNRLEKCALSSSSGKEMLERAKTKKYTDARLRRAALFALTGVTKDDLAKSPDYTVLLAANSSGRKILSGAKSIEIVTKPADAKTQSFVLETLADRLFALCSKEGAAPEDFLKKSPCIC